MSPQDFIKTYSKHIIDACKGTTLFPSVKLAQAALETGWGKSVIGEANNMFGIKGRGAKTPYWNGDVVNKATQEFTNGAYHTVNEPFRKYNSLVDSIKDHTYFLQQNPRYKMVFEAKTPEAQAKALLACGYATDPPYADKLMSIVNSNNLTLLDKAIQETEEKVNEGTKLVKQNPFITIAIVSVMLVSGYILIKTLFIKN